MSSEMVDTQAIVGLLQGFLGLVVLIVSGVATVFYFILRKTTRSSVEAKDAIKNFNDNTVPAIKTDLKNQLESQQKLNCAQMDTLRLSHETLAASNQRQEAELKTISDSLIKISATLPTNELKFMQNDKDHKEINKRIDENQNFNIDWKQRIEDKIEDAEVKKSTSRRRRSS